jgi:hypothetical protein
MKPFIVAVIAVIAFAVTLVFGLLFVATPNAPSSVATRCGQHCPGKRDEECSHLIKRNRSSILTSLGPIGLMVLSSKIPRLRVIAL